jgi:hypothetical protein
VKAARKLSRRAVKVGRSAVKAKLPAGTRTVNLTLGKGALRAAKSFRRKRGKKVTFNLTTTDARGGTTPLAVKVKLR